MSSFDLIEKIWSCLIFIELYDFLFITQRMGPFSVVFFLLFALSIFYFHVHLLKYAYLKVNIFVMCARTNAKMSSENIKKLPHYIHMKHTQGAFAPLI